MTDYQLAISLQLLIQTNTELIRHKTVMHFFCVIVPKKKTSDVTYYLSNSIFENVL